MPTVTRRPWGTPDVVAVWFTLFGPVSQLHFTMLSLYFVSSLSDHYITWTIKEQGYLHKYLFKSSLNLSRNVMSHSLNILYSSQPLCVPCCCCHLFKGFYWDHILCHFIYGMVPSYLYYVYFPLILSCEEYIILIHHIFILQQNLLKL